MTRIEERLRDALQASAAQVRDDRLRPLPAPAPDAQAPDAQAPDSRTERRRAWRGWLIPAAAAASVVLVIGLVQAVTRHATPGQPKPASQQAIPTYFARFVQTSTSSGIQVQSVSTGAVTAYLPSPKSPRGGALNIDALAAAPDDRTFYVEYGLVSPNIDVTQTRIFSFGITSDGTATPLRMLKGGLLSHQPPGLQTWGNLAVSPDGSKLALTVNTSNHITNTSPGYSDKIIVIDVRTGQRTQWQGGLDRPGRTFSISDLSWSADGRSLIFLGQWCTAMVAPACNGTQGGTQGSSGYRDAQVWSLSTSAAGGPLTRGRLLLRQSARYPLIAQAVAGPQGESLAVLSGQANKFGQRPNLTIEEARSVVYRVSRPESPQQVLLTADPSGQHLLVSYAVDGGFLIGWIEAGALHLLPITQPYLPNNATLVIAW
jgi:hypothetical protein